MAVAAFGALLVMMFTHSLDQQLAQLSLSSKELAQIHASRLQLAAIKTSDPELGRAISESFIQAYRTVIWIAVCSTFTATVAGWFLIKPRSRYAKWYLARRQFEGSGICQIWRSL